MVYTDHASLCTATQSPQLSQKMAQWLSFFAEYTFEIKYKPWKQNPLADALSRRPDYELAHLTILSSSILDLICAGYARNDHCVALLHAHGSDDLNTRTLICRHNYVRAYIGIISITGCCAIAQMLRILLVLWSS